MRVKPWILTASLLWASPLFAQETALASLREAAKGAPTDSAAQLALGRALIEAGKLDEAQAQLAKVVKLEKGSIESLYEAMRPKLAGDDYKAARAGCQALVSKDADHILSQVCMARAYLVWRRSSRAVEHVDKARLADPGHYEVLLVDADTERMQGQHDAALAAYAKAAAADPKRTEPLVGTALVHVVRNDAKAAIEALRKALVIGSDDPDVLFELGRLVEGAEAVQLLQRAVAGRPGWPEARLALAVAQVREGDAKAAEPVLRAVLAKDRNNQVASTQLGAALVALGNYEEAQRLLTAALEAMPNDFDASFALAQLYERTGQNEEAFTQYRNAGDLKRESARALVAAARLGVELNRPLLAAALLDKALERAPKSAQALALYGDVALTRGDKPTARDYYQRALQGEGPLDRDRVQKQLGGLK